MIYYFTYSFIAFRLLLLNIVNYKLTMCVSLVLAHIVNLMIMQYARNSHNHYVCKSRENGYLFCPLKDNLLHKNRSGRFLPPFSPFCNFSFCLNFKFTPTLCWIFGKLHYYIDYFLIKLST